MLDLNSLTLYKEKISSYVDENALDISTTSNILGMFKIKNYTGKGIEINPYWGNVKIDENGIATGFRIGHYIQTGLSANILNTDNFEIQTKFKLSSLRPSNGWSYIWPTTCNGYNPVNRNLISLISFNSSNYTLSGFWIYNLKYDDNYLISDKYSFPCTNETEAKNAIVDKWFVFNQKFSKDNVETTLIDENDKVLYNNINTYKYRPKDTSVDNSGYICFGNMVESSSAPTNIAFDLSECYIKIDDELVSTWNM